MRLIFLAIACWLLTSHTLPAIAEEHVTLDRQGVKYQIDGKILLTTEDGFLLQARDGVIWSVRNTEIAEQVSDDTEYTPLSNKELAEQLLAEMPSGFKTHSTAHYLICYNTSEAYARWVGGLYERLFRAFYGYWRQRGFELQEPELPMVALAFDTQAHYAAYAKAEIGEATRVIVGYFSPRANRVAMYDLTGVEGARGGPVTNARINQMLSAPGAEANVATIVHEATHQLAFNSGMHQRYADVPLWLSEGMAIYFESPDLRSRTGWRGIGTVHHSRLTQFRRSLASKTQGHLKDLIAADRLFRSEETAAEAYAWAWALNYFLIRSKSKEYVDYLKMLADKKPLVNADEPTRLREFEQHFGDIGELEAEFLRAMQRVR